MVCRPQVWVARPQVWVCRPPVWQLHVRAVPVSRSPEAVDSGG
jgi:hypothetical protein